MSDEDKAKEEMVKKAVEAAALSLYLVFKVAKMEECIIGKVAFDDEEFEISFIKIHKH